MSIMLVITVIPSTCTLINIFYQSNNYECKLLNVHVCVWVNGCACVYIENKHILIHCMCIEYQHLHSRNK